MLKDFLDKPELEPAFEPMFGVSKAKFNELKDYISQQGIKRVNQDKLLALFLLNNYYVTQKIPLAKSTLAITFKITHQALTDSLKNLTENIETGLRNKTDSESKKSILEVITYKQGSPTNNVSNYLNYVSFKSGVDVKDLKITLNLYTDANVSALTAAPINQQPSLTASQSSAAATTSTGLNTTDELEDSELENSEDASEASVFPQAAPLAPIAYNKQEDSDISEEEVIGKENDNDEDLIDGESSEAFEQSTDIPTLTPAAPTTSFTDEEIDELCEEFEKSASTKAQSSSSTTTSVASTSQSSASTSSSSTSSGTGDQLIQVMPKKNITDNRYIYFSNNLDVKFSSKRHPAKVTFIEGNYTHRMMKKVEKSKYRALKELGHIDSSTNILIAKLIFLVSELPYADRNNNGHKIKHIELDIYNTNEQYLWLPSSLTDNQILPLLIEARTNIKQCLGANEYSNKTGLYGKTDFHSETSFYYYLKQNLENISVRLLEKLNNEKKHKIYGLIIDMHSTNNMCENCSPLTGGFINSDEQGFIKDLKDELRSRKYEFIVAKNFYVLPRYSYTRIDPDHKPKEAYTKKIEDQIHDIKTIPLKDNDGSILRHNFLHQSLEKPAALPNLTLFFSGKDKKERLTLLNAKHIDKLNKQLKSTHVELEKLKLEKQKLKENLNQIVKQL